MHDFCYKKGMNDKDSRSEPHIEIFGDSMRHHHRHHDSGNPVAGVMFLFAGIVLLFNSIGTVPWAVWHTIWQFWPVLFIFMGLHIILGESILSGLVLFIIAVFVFGIIAIFSLQSVSSPLVSHLLLPPEITGILNYLRRYIL